MVWQTVGKGSGEISRYLHKEGCGKFKIRIGFVFLIVTSYIIYIAICCYGCKLISGLFITSQRKPETCELLDLRIYINQSKARQLT